jgi:hypothetical protein
LISLTSLSGLPNVVDFIGVSNLVLDFFLSIEKKKHGIFKGLEKVL